MLLNTITPLVITYNEADNIERTLGKLTWAEQIIVVDSGSTDETVEIINRFKQARIVFRQFDDFASQCNFGLSLIETRWALSLDADYELTDDLISEISCVEPGDEISGYRANFVYRIYGRPLRGTLYPPRVVLYQHQRARYRKEGHGHRIEIEGAVSGLKGKIFHDDRKPFARWVASQQRYAKNEAEHLFATPSGCDGIRRPNPMYGLASATADLPVRAFREGLHFRRLAWLDLCTATYFGRDHDLARASRTPVEGIHRVT